MTQCSTRKIDLKTIGINLLPASEPLFLSCMFMFIVKQSFDLAGNYRVGAGVIERFCMG